jgi:hypothetical protein
MIYFFFAFIALAQMSEHPENPFEPDTVCTDSKSVTGLK